ncbi:hypothetical protein AMTRI_Chr02g263280 [Amborella trichopoda]
MSRASSDGFLLFEYSAATSNRGSDASVHGIRVSIDLVSAARRHLCFLKTLVNSPWLLHNPSLHRAIRRYRDLWMPLIAENSGSRTLLLPPLDIQWIWTAHCLNPVAFRRYCVSKFGKLIEKPAIFDEENEDYAWNRCRGVWERKYPSQPFDLEEIDAMEGDDPSDLRVDGLDLVLASGELRSLYARFSEPFMGETSFLIAAKHRYKGFLYMLQRLGTNGSQKTCVVPTSDILLMWTTHQTFPISYAEDTREIGEILGKVVGQWGSGTSEDVRTTAKLWESTFDRPYQKAGASFDRVLLKPTIFSEVSAVDINKKWKSLGPRFLIEVCISIKRDGEEKGEEKWEEKNKGSFLQLRFLRCHRQCKIDTPVSSLLSNTQNSWQQTWHLQCEFGTKGFVIELWRSKLGCFRSNNLQERLVFLWNDLLRAPSLTLSREIEQSMGSKLRVVASITPPIQAPYLLKCVPDLVTDDRGAMVSDVILRMNKFRPQEGRWLTRTVLDHAGKECFVVRIRVGRGIWRRRGEAPVGVKWEERIIQVCHGSWSYVAGSVGIAPGNVAGTAIPREDGSQDRKVTWSLSNGYDFTIQCNQEPRFWLENKDSPQTVRLMNGRKLHYEVQGAKPEEEEGFLTMARFTPDSPNGKATALMNWKLFAMEVLPEEDAVLVLLICTAMVQTMCEARREDVGNFLVRKRLKEAKRGSRDWGSVTLHPSSSLSSSIVDPWLQPWYLNAAMVMALPDPDYKGGSQTRNSHVDGGKGLYEMGRLLAF